MVGFEVDLFLQFKHFQIINILVSLYAKGDICLEAGADFLGEYLYLAYLPGDSGNHCFKGGACVLLSTVSSGYFVCLCYLFLDLILLLARKA